jgi:hypothetical protein
MKRCLGSSVGIETLVRVTDERQAGGVHVVASLGGLSPVRSASVLLINFVDREVGRIDVGV